MNYTSHYELNKPELAEQFNLADWNKNSDKIDTQMFKNETDISALNVEFTSHKNNTQNPHSVGGNQLSSPVPTEKIADGAVTPAKMSDSTFLLPIATVLPYAGSLAPDGYLICNGQAVSRTTYAALFAIIGTTYGNGNGSTTFNVPDLRETAIVGAGQRGSGVTTHDTYSLGQFKDDQLQGHYHGHNKTSVWGGETQASNNKGAMLWGQVSDTEQTISRTYTTQYQNDDEHGNPRIGYTTHGKQMGMNYIIKY